MSIGAKGPVQMCVGVRPMAWCTGRHWHIPPPRPPSLGTEPVTEAVPVVVISPPCTWGAAWPTP